MIDIVCFKQGSLYPACYVNRLANMVDHHMTVPHSFTVYTDDPAGVDAPCKPLSDPTFTGWWSKLSIFRPRERRILCLDLDTVIVANCDFLAEYDGPFALLRDFYKGASHYGSAIMSLQAGIYGKEVWEQFTPQMMQQHRGDQDYIQSVFPEADLWQDVFPGKIVSYKAHCQKQGRIPDGAAIVCFHGHPRPHELPAGDAIRNLWESYAS